MPLPDPSVESKETLQGAQTGRDVGGDKNRGDGWREGGSQEW